jgi:DNA-binding NarL/FixJ family response regulator
VIRVLVVDDENLIRGGLAALIQAAPDMEVAGQAADGDTAIALTGSLMPDVILMDIGIPGTNGVAATERILAQAGDPRPRILILTVLDPGEYVYAALRAGASGFLLKESRPEQVLTAIRVIASGDSLLGPTAIQELIRACSPRPAAGSPQPPDCLTPRETEVIRHVATGADNAEIASMLSVTEATVKTHLNRAMAKLGLRSRAQVVVFAYETRLVTPGNGGPTYSA